LLWVANYGGPVSGFSTTQLASSGSPTPALSVNADGPLAFAIDASGGAWTCPGIGDTLYYYTQSQLFGGGTPKPSTRILAGSAIWGITAMAFDAVGDLWVAGQYSNSLIEYTPAQLAAGGSPTPAVAISAVFGSLQRPFSMAFDAKGDLWVGSVTDSSIVAYSPSQLRAGGELVPTYAITSVPGISAPLALAFDAAGDLWVGDDLGPISEFVPSQLASIGSPKPAVVLTMPPNAASYGLAFDNSGDLWVSDFQNSQLLEYTPSELTATGKPTPAAIIKSNGSSIKQPGGLAFSPHASNLPF
jgi:ligand-binding sensor domain-containing protein